MFANLPYGARHLVVIFWSLVSGPALAAIPFTGLVTDDFAPESCLTDPGGEDVGMPSAFPATEISGFDIRSVCWSYDPTGDTLYIGIRIYNDASNVPLVFGDADGDGFQDSAGLVLQTLLGEDRADLGTDEFFTFVLDFDGDDIPDLVAGTHNENDVSAFAIRDGEPSPNNDLRLAGLERFYGDPLPASLSVSLAFVPTSDRPHLEFSIAGLSTLPEYGVLDFSDPDSFFRLYVTAGSFADDGIAEEYFPNNAAWRSLTAEALLDTDGDTINDLFDPDPPPSESDEADNAEGGDSGGGTRPVVAPVRGNPGDGETQETDNRLGGDVDLTGGPVRLQGGCASLAGAAPFGMFYWIFLLIYFAVVPKVWALRADHFSGRTEPAAVLSPGRFSLGLNQTVSHSPLEFGRTATGQTLDNVVSYFYAWDVSGRVGLLKNWEIGLHVPAALAAQVEDLDSSVERNTSSMGDMRLEAKWNFWRALSLLTFLDIPTGASDDFFGEANVTGGWKVLGEWKSGKHFLAGHVGFLGRGNETIRASGMDLLKIGPDFLWGAHYTHDLSKKWLAWTHLWGSSDFRSEATTPLEWDLGFAKGLAKIPLQISFGAGFGLNGGYGLPLYRLILGIKYAP